jgi:RNA polymerase sigma-70 factor (ECF subfamily)
MTVFGTTVWTVVKRAGEESQSAIVEIVKSYGPPVRRFLKSRGLDEHSAEDLTQEVFKRFFVDGVLKKADPARGRFRSLVLGVTRNVYSEEIRRRAALKRKEPPREAAAAASTEEVFDRLWLEHLLDQAVGRLVKAGGKVPYAEILDAHARKGLSYAEIGKKWGGSEGAARNWVHRARAHLAEELRGLVKEYSTSKEDFEEEMGYLSRFLP